MAAVYMVHTAKALESIVWLATAKPGIDIFHVITCAYFADRLHVRAYGRPIAGDDYTAGAYGPVGRTVYGLLRQEPLAVLALGGNGRLPFNVTETGWIVAAEREPNLRILSRSDVAALQRALDRYGDMPFDELVEITHHDPAYRAANGGRMRYEDFLDPDDPELAVKAEDLAESSRYAVM
jgi:uncharacterized phage-associated protein